MLEVAAIVFLGLGLGHRSVKPATVSAPATVSSKVSVPETDVATVLTALRRLGRSATNAELAVIMGVSPGEASKRAKACETPSSRSVKADPSGSRSPACTRRQLLPRRRKVAGAFS
jgi:hypothetical protein